MAELTISADEIRAALDDYVASYSPEVSREEVGTVAETGDGIARVEGLPSAMTNELLRFEDGTLGLAQTLDVREIGVVILGEQQGIDEGQTVRRTGDILSVPVGDGFLGRVIDPLGQPIDGLGEIREEARRPLELQAPSVPAPSTTSRTSCSGSAGSSTASRGCCSRWRTRWHRPTARSACWTGWSASGSTARPGSCSSTPSGPRAGTASSGR